MTNRHSDEQIDRALAYLASKQCANGGFCGYRMEYLEEPNPRDTLFSVASFQLLGEAVPHRDHIITYLDSVLVDLQAHLLPLLETSPETHSAYAFTYLYFPLFTLHTLGELQLDASWQSILNRLTIGLPTQAPTQDSQQALLRKVRVKHLTGAISNRQDLIEFVLTAQHQGGFGLKPNLIDTYLSLALLKELDYDLSALADTRQFIQRLQTPYLGFTLTSDSLMTNLEVIHAGIFASLMLAMDIPSLEAALKFVHMCQMERGGFARMPVALPDIESTYRALKVLTAARAL
jgi:hypothetical protein